MEENTPESAFKSLSFLRRIVGLNYHAIQLEKDQRKKFYVFLLGLPLFIVVGIFFLRDRNTQTSTFQLEQFVVAGVSFISVFGFTKLLLRFTSDKMKALMDDFERKQDLVLRKILIRYSLIYYGVSFVVILVLAVI